MTNTELLQLDGIQVIYENVILGVQDISLKVANGSIVALLGANGAGKSTTLKAISRLLPSERGEVVRGRIRYGGQDVSRLSPAALVRQGLVQVLEGRHCFAHLTVEENLLMGAFVRKPKAKHLKQDLERIYAYFPRLKDKRSVASGYTSGGEQQMVALGRALMAKPKLILLDEPSMGLAPQIVEEIFIIIRQLNEREEVSFLLAEQNATLALELAHHGYLIENGRIAAEGSGSHLLASDAIRSAYLGKIRKKVQGNSR